MSVNPPPPPYGGPPGPPPAAYPPPPGPPAGYPPPAYGAPSAPPPKKTNWIPWVAGGCGCLLVALVAFGLIAYLGVKAGTAGAEKTIQAFLKAAGDENYEAAYGYFSAPLKATQSYEDFAAEASQNAHLFKVKDTTFTERSVDMTTAKLAGSVTLEAGTKVPAKFQLVQENDQWRLIGYNIGQLED